MKDFGMAVLMFAATATAGAANSPYWGALKAGEFDPGVKRVSFDGGPGPASRNISALAFYPASGSGELLTFAQLIDRNCGGPGCADEWSKSLSNYRKDLPPEQLRALLDHSLASRFEAPALRGKFPVVVFDGGLTTDALTYVPLNEFLASHGFIVISLPSLPGADGKPLKFDVAGVESKARDVLTVVQQLDRVPNTDARRVALAAWSVGGVSITLAQMQSHRVRAVLSLDGGMGYDYGPPLAKQSSLYDVEKASVAYLHVTGTKPNPFNVAKGFGFFAELGSRHAFLAELQNVNHAQFIAQGGAVTHVGPRDSAADEFWAANEQLARLSLLFLNDFVKAPKGKGFLERANRLSPALLKLVSAKQ